MLSKRIMVVDLSIVPERMNDFDDFYNHVYIPAFIEAAPEIISARRYAQTDALGTVNPAKARFLTVYQPAFDDSLNQIEARIQKWGNTDVSQHFKLWKQNGLTYFDRGSYEEIYQHIRQPQDGPWSNRPLLGFMWTAKPECFEAEKWYHEVYAKHLMDDVPAWLACRTYARLDCEQKNYLTVFEAADERSLTTALVDTDSPQRAHDNAAMHRWQKEFLSSYTLMPFRMMYRFA